MAVQRGYVQRIGRIEQVGTGIHDAQTQQTVAGGHRVHAVHGVAPPVGRQGDGITHGRRTEQRQDQIRSGLDAPVPQSQTEVLLVTLDLHLAGNVQQTTEAEHGIGGETHHVVIRLGTIALQRKVHHGPQVAQVAKEIGHAGAHRAWHHGLVAGCHGLENGLVHIVIERGHGAVVALERVLRMRCLCRGTASQYQAAYQNCTHACGAQLRLQRKMRKTHGALPL